MSISDVVITKPGGLTTSESLASHLPLIIINPIPGQEEENAEFLEQYGCGVWLKKIDEAKEIISSILLNDEKLEYMKEKSIQLSRPNSSKDICKIIFEQ
jgi:processive 1,2-diacylglycerol beta-glucosyltransferase